MSTRGGIPLWQPIALIAVGLLMVAGICVAIFTA